MRQDDGFAIQVTALSGKTEAEAIADRLKRKGYAVYLVSAPPGQPATYKVRVGKFSAENVDCAVLGADSSSAPSLLGMSFLEKLDETSFRGGRLILKN